MTPSTSSTAVPVPMHPGPEKIHVSTHAEAEAARGMDHTNSWSPSSNRRQSWSKEDQKHACQMSVIDDVKTGPGFTEKTS